MSSYTLSRHGNTKPLSFKHEKTSLVMKLVFSGLFILITALTGLSFFGGV